MKKLLLITALCTHILHPMEETPLQTCQRIEQISPDAPTSAYVDLAKRFAQAKLTVCSCIKRLANNRIESTKPALRQEWGITDQHWKEIDEFNKKTSEQDALPGKLEINPLTVAGFDGERQVEVPQQDFIAQQFKKVGKQNNRI